MSAQMKHTLAALLAAAAIIVPASAEAKGDKGRGGGGGGHEQNHVTRGGGEARGGGKKHGEQRDARAIEDQRPVPQRGFEARGNGNANHARAERSAPARMSAGGRSRHHDNAGPGRWADERHVERRARADSGRRADRPIHNSVAHAYEQRSELAAKSERKVAKRERDWVKQERRALRQARKAAPVVVYERSLDNYRRAFRYADAPVYRVPERRDVTSYPAYATGSSDASYYRSYDASSYPEWSYPQNYSAYSAYDIQSPYGSYDPGYGDGGLGGLFGGGGGLGEILGTLLPLILGESLGLDGLTGSLGSGLADNSLPGLESGYGPDDYSAAAYEDPLNSLADPSVDFGLLGADENLSGGDGLMSLVELALGSGLLVGDAAGLGGIGDLLAAGDGFDSGDLPGSADPIYAYTDPYASNAGLLKAFGV